jgi:alpha-mannosidase
MTTDSGTGAQPLHVIANAHMDPVWIWDWREGYGEVWATFRSALDRIAEHQDLIFTASSAAFHAWIEEHDPAMFAEIRAAVAAGRWYLAGGMWIEPDCNLPSGESMCRQLLAGQRYFRRAFGRIATVGYNPDSFGHSAGLPQLLTQAGLTSYVFMRPGEHERELPAHLFGWRDRSGAVLPAYRIPFDYGTEDPAGIAGLLRDGAALAAAEGAPLMIFVGVGNHGGGPTRATLAEVDLAVLADSGLADEPALRYSDPGRYFAARQAELPEVTGELQHHAVGCYSVSAWAKAANDHAEAALLDAEITDLIAAGLAARPARQPELSAAWGELLLCQFHDILAGTASSRACPTVASRFGHVETVADRVTTNAVYQIAHRVDTSPAPGPPVERHWSFWSGTEGQGVPFHIFNPLPWPVRQPVIATRPADQVLDSAGREVAHQAVASGEVTLYSSHTLFVAELAPLGYEVFWLRGGQRRRDIRPAAGPAVIESDLLRAEIDQETGAITSLRETGTGRELAGAGGIRLELRSDASDTWSHGLARYDGEVIAGRLDGVELIEAGPVRWLVRIRLRFGDSTVTQDVSLVRGQPHAQVRIRADWSEPRVVLKLLLPWRLGRDVAVTAGAAYGIAERAASGGEEPVQGWLDCYSPSGGAGIGLTTGHLHGYSADGEVVGLTVLRNPRAADHGGSWGERDEADFGCTDTGPHDATIRIHPHQGDWRSAELAARAAEQQRPPLVVADTYHAGTLPPRGGFLTVTPPVAGVVRAIKRAESGGAVVIRLVEPAGRPLTVTLGGPAVGREVRAVLGPYEVRTLLVPDDPGAPVRPVTVTEFALDG